MSQNTATETPTPTTSAESAPPNIAALPTPSETEILREKLADAERDAAVLRADNLALSEKCGKLTEHRDHLDAKVRELETNPFTFALANMDAGAVLATAGEELQKLVAIVRRRDAKGTFTFKIAVKPFKGDALDFIPEIKITEPKPEPAHAIFYTSEEGALSRNDPRQKEFGFLRGDRSSSAEDDAYADERRKPELR